jgi:hypothetical protein
MSQESPSPVEPPRVVLELKVPTFVWVALAAATVLFAWGAFIVADEWVAGNAAERHLTAPVTPQPATQRP